jgi:hypothetical protein
MQQGEQPSTNMDDDDLAQIRQKRLAEMQKQSIPSGLPPGMVRCNKSIVKTLKVTAKRRREESSRRCKETNARANLGVRR